MSISYEVGQALLFLTTWLLPLALLLLILGLLWRKRRAGQIALWVAGLLFLLTATAYATGDVSWRLFPALVNGYHYDPNEAPPDPLLVPRRPELLIERQLTALIGQTGPAPLRQDSPLTAFTIDAVHIDNWHRAKGLTAVLDTTLIFADGRQEAVPVTLLGRGGNLLVPFLGKVNRNAYAWYAPESSLGHLLQTPAPATPVRDDMPPITLALVQRVKASGLAGINPNTSLLFVADVSADGRLLLDVDLRQERTAVGNALLYYANGQTERLAETFISTRAHFSPDGRRLAYAHTQRNRPLQLIMREADGLERRLSTVDWMTQHWVGDDHIAYSRNGAAYLYDLNSGASRFLVAVAPQRGTMEFRIAPGGEQTFRVAPDGRRIAYQDIGGQLWVKTLPDGPSQHIGWDVTDLSWSIGLTWRGDGQQLLFTTRDTTVLPNQQELWLWDASSNETRLLVRTGPGFLNQRRGEATNLGSPCWLDDETILLAAYIPNATGQLYVLAARTDGSGVWDVTPTDGPFPYPELHCANGSLAISAERTAVALYQMR